MFENTGRLDLVKQKAYSNLGEFSGLCCDDETKKSRVVCAYEAGDDNDEVEAKR